jgi:hypothetical protein
MGQPWDRLGHRRVRGRFDPLLARAHEAAALSRRGGADDRGGSNGARVRLWKVKLQALADETGLTLHVRHYPPGTSKWNKIEHRLFRHITQSWRGRPLTAARVAAHFAGVATGSVTRYEMPNVGALNFVLKHALGGGVTRLLALDAHGKSLGSLMLDLEV